MENCLNEKSNLVSLVIFTCEGREHLLEQTYKSFNQVCKYKFFEIILVMDGKIDPSIISLVKPDTGLQQPKRLGYVSSIILALKHINTPYFFWLEDDFIFNQKIPINYILDVISNDQTWVAIFLSRTAPLTQNEKQYHYFDNLYKPDFGFSVSPSLCNTIYVQNAFEALTTFSKSDNTKYVGFEPFIDEYFIQNKLKYAVLDPGQTSHVQHIGFMESTGREFHMINSIETRKSNLDNTYISGFGKEKTITFYNKVTMLPKLWLAVIVLSFRLFRHRRSYDFAFRVYISYLKKFKY